MSKLKVIKHTSLASLKNDIKANLSRYENGQTATIIDPIRYGTHTTSISLSEVETNIKNPEKNPENKNNHDLENCLHISNLYQNLTPLQATDERVWVYATHITFSEYVKNRWALPEKNSDEEDDAYEKRKIRHIENHYFAKNDRAIMRDNAISRLWWMGYIAKRSELPQEETLKILLKKSDVRANILERPGLNMSQEIFNQIILKLKDNSDLDNRVYFRDFMKKLNMIGGMTILNALEKEKISNLFNEIIEKIISSPR